jgi:hypothetical protein
MPAVDKAEAEPYFAIGPDDNGPGTQDVLDGLRGTFEWEVEKLLAQHKTAQLAVHISGPYGSYFFSNEGEGNDAESLYMRDNDGLSFLRDQLRKKYSFRRALGKTVLPYDNYPSSELLIDAQKAHTLETVYTRVAARNGKLLDKAEQLHLPIGIVVDKMIGGQLPSFDDYLLTGPIRMDVVYDREREGLSPGVRILLSAPRHHGVASEYVYSTSGDGAVLFAKRANTGARVGSEFFRTTNAMLELAYHMGALSVSPPYNKLPPEPEGGASVHSLHAQVVDSSLEQAA